VEFEINAHYTDAKQSRMLISAIAAVTEVKFSFTSAASEAQFAVRSRGVISLSEFTGM